MKTAKFIVAGALIGTLLAGCGGSVDSDGSQSPEDAQSSLDAKYDDLPDVTVPYVTYKIDGITVNAFCDGHTRVFIKYNALAAVPNSPECNGQ